MSVFSRVKGFFSRHRNKFIVGGVLITGTVLLTRYAQQRLKEWQEDETKKFLERNRKLQHFESIGRTCNQTTLNLSASLFDVVFKTVDTEEIIEMLKTNPENRLELWNKLKLLVFVKAGCMIYGIVMLVVTLRIQLSIIGGYLYKDPDSVSTEMQEKYLCLCQNFLNHSIGRLSTMLEVEVGKIMESVDLKKQLMLSDLESLFWSIQTAVGTSPKNPIDELRQHIIPEDALSGKSIYNDIIRDTADFLDSDEVKSLATHCINRGFILLTDLIADFYETEKIRELPADSNGGDFLNPFISKKPMAKLIPIINGLISKQSLPQQFVQQLVTNEKLQKLGANVYESLL